MAATPFLWLLYATRIVAGVSGANMAVASAYIADITSPEDRGKRFGQMNAAFGIGFIAGPVLGGWLGEVHLRAPFVMASALCAANLIMGYFFLPESSPMALRHERPVWKWSAINPFMAMHGAFSNARLRPFLGVYGVLAIIGQVGAAIWVIYGQDRYHWSTLVVGVSLALFGLAHAGAQAFLPGPLIKRVGERWAAFVAMMVDGAAYIWVGVATKGWMVLVSTPVFCIGGVAVPALQALMTQEVHEDDQGQLQGNLAALNSLASPPFMPPPRPACRALSGSPGPASMWSASPFCSSAAGPINNQPSLEISRRACQHRRKQDLWGKSPCAV
jgi:DHA1 family tetracycline resistance protein-like MFS transporter